jgi:hypothetical protein
MWLRSVALLVVLSMLGRRLGAWDGSSAERLGDRFRAAARSAISAMRSSTVDCACECAEPVRDEGKSAMEPKLSVLIALSSGEASAERFAPRFFSPETTLSTAESTSTASYAISEVRQPAPRLF